MVAYHGCMSGKELRRSDRDRLKVSLRIILESPPAGVQFCLQRGTELAEPATSNGQDLAFDFFVEIAGHNPNGSPRVLGPFTQGPPGSRFVYVCSGTRAGQPESGWNRRAKVPLKGITVTQIEQIRAAQGTRLEVRIPGTSRDGGPVCASVRLPDGGWQLIS